MSKKEKEDFWNPTNRVFPSIEESLRLVGSPVEALILCVLGVPEGSEIACCILHEDIQESDQQEQTFIQPVAQQMSFFG